MPQRVLIYVSMCVPNNKLYFGITVETLCRRSKKHASAAAKGSSYPFHNAIRKYGVRQFVWYEIGYVATWSDACEVETLLIKWFSTRPPTGYNATDGGDGSFGVSPSATSRQKISDTLKAWHASDDPQAVALRAKVSAARKNAVFSDLTRDRLSKARLGWTLSEESRAKLSVSKRVYSDEVVAEVSTYAAQHGFRAAARKYDIPHKTIRRWTLSPAALEEDKRKMRERGRRLYVSSNVRRQVDPDPNHR